METGKSGSKLGTGPELRLEVPLWKRGSGAQGQKPTTRTTISYFIHLEKSAHDRNTIKQSKH